MNIVFVLYCAYTNISFVSMIPHEQSVCQHSWRNSCRKQATFLGTEDAYEQFTMQKKYIGDFYSGEEISELFKIAKGSPIELEVLLGAFYGLRRSEIVGLKWNAIDFTNNTITVKHTVTSCTIDGKKVIEAKDRAKSKASLRTLPLVPAFREKLLEVKKQQEEYKRLCGRS